MFALLGYLTGCEDEPSSKDMVPPTISGTHDFTHTIGDEQPDYLKDVTAHDLSDGDLTDRMTVDDSAVDLLVAGIYDLIYRVRDFDGFESTMTVQVIVLEEKLEPNTTRPLFLDFQDFTHTIGEETPDYLETIRAYDAEEGYITERITYDDSDVDLETEGTYDLTYTVADSFGNQASKTVKVLVIESSLPSLSSLNIYNINDTHGAILANGSEMGLSRIGNLIIDEREEKPEETVFIANGDILQGTLISNYFFGEAAIAALNAMELDAFVLGNHEFDWGLEVVNEYFNPDTEGLKAEFPLLGANVFYKGTREIPAFIDPYTVVTKGELEVGIIGLMGYGLESSIATSRIADYEFGDPLVEAAYYSEYLRVEEGVDVVIVAIHGANDAFNQAVGDLSGNAYVDAVFNGHTHRAYTRFESRTGVNMPVIQSGANGEYVGHLHLDLTDGVVTGYQAANLNANSDARLNQSSAIVDEVIAPYLEVVEPLLTETIITAGEYLGRGDLTTYMARLMRTVTDSDIAFHNSGGTRTDVYAYEAMTMSTLYQIFPFDNRIKTVYLTGLEIKGLLADSHYAYHDIRAGLTFIDDERYLVATNDFVFDDTSEPFIYGVDPVDTAILIRDVFYDVLVELALTEDYFYLDSPILLGSPITAVSYDPFTLPKPLGITHVNGFRKTAVI